MYLHEDSNLQKAVDDLIVECDKHNMKVTIVASSESGMDEDGDPLVQYSSLGNTEVASKHYVAMYADYANDLLELAGEEKANPILNSHIQLLTNTYWKFLDATKKAAH